MTVTTARHTRSARLKRGLASAFALSAIVALSACGLGKQPGQANANTDQSKIVIATDDGTEKHWQIIKQKLKDEGIDLEVKTFSDGVQINNATKNGDVDVNLFQHLAYLAQYDAKNNANLVPVGATAVYPLALYSKEVKSVQDLPANAEIAIPNNPTNQARALRNLQEAGLLTLKGGGNSLSTPADIESSKVKITAVDTNQTVNALSGSADAAVVNNTQAQKGGLTKDNVIYKDNLDSGTNDAYINAFVTTEDKKDDERWKKLTAVYHSADVEKAVTELNGGNLEFKADWSADKLQDLLKKEIEVAKSGQGEANSASATATP